MVAELTAAGLTIKRLAEVLDDLRDALIASPLFGPGVAVGDASVLGQVIKPVGAEIASLHELAQQLYDAFRPDAAEGAQLDNLVGLNGVVRKPATKSTGTITASGMASTVIPAGSRVRVPSGPVFETTADGTIGGGGTVDIAVEALDTGPLEAAAGAITEIVTAVSGWTGVTNGADITPGNDVETDAELRDRRERSLTVTGAGTDQAIRARLEAIAEVEHATVISNRSLVTDSRGIPGKAFRAVLWPTGLDGPTIVKAIWDVMPAGILADGTEVHVVTDDQGHDQPVAFSYATERAVYVDVTVTPGPDYPAGGDTLVEQAVLDYAAELRVGDDVLPVRMTSRIVRDVPGVDHLVILVKVGGWPTGTDDDPIAIDLDEIATFDAARITVSS